jgi:hypothetical protein
MSEEIPVGVSYRVHDEGASKAAEHIGKSLDHAGHASHGLSRKLGELRQELGLTAPALLGVGFGLGMWVEKAEEAATEFGRTKRAAASTLATVLDWDKGTTVIDRYRRSSVLAAEVTEKLQDVHARFGPQLEELGNAYRTIAISGAPLKLNQQQLLDLTMKSAAASKLFGVTGEDAAARIGNALMGRVRPGGDAFNRLLSNMLGNVKKVSREKVFEGMTKQLDKLVPMADEASKGIGDSMRRIQHQVDMLFEHASAPLFKEIATSLGQAAKEMEHLGASGRPLVEEYAEKLVDAFKFLKTTTQFLFDHWKEIAAVWVGMKAVNLGTSIAGAMAKGGGVGGGGIAGVVKGSGIPLLSMAAGLGIEKGVEFYDQVKSRNENMASMRGVLSSWSDFKKAGPGADGSKLQAVQGSLAAAGIHTAEEAMARLDSLQASMRVRSDKAYFGAKAASDEHLGMSWQMANEFRQDLQLAIKGGMLKLEDGEKEGADSKLRTTGKAPINIANATFKFDFENTDPDRVFIRVSDELEKFYSRRTQSAITPPGVE